MHTPERIISINGVPRSGTSWLGQIINSSPDVAFRFQPLFSYTHKGALREDSSVMEIMKFYGDILGFKEIWRGSTSGRVLNWVNFSRLRFCFS